MYVVILFLYKHGLSYSDMLSLVLIGGDNFSCGFSFDYGQCEVQP